MGLMKLSEQQMNYFDKLPETAMGLHLARSEDATLMPSSVVYVLGGQVALILDDDAKESISKLLPALREPKEGNATAEDQERFETWHWGLPTAPHLQELGPAWPILGMIMHPSGYVPPTPHRPSYVYGHLPFTCITDPNDVLYRCEPWPISRRINQANQKIAKDTYACPASELPFFPTGFAAVGRYALPNLMPACYRWKLQPVAGTSLDCGASVPLYGQAGGGVEVRFRGLTKNRTPIANPVVLPPL